LDDGEFGRTTPESDTDIIDLGVLEAEGESADDDSDEEEVVG
jgi:hypothetical protein